ncbi:MAG: DUF4007 family protein [Chloroflexota bacterium]|nr:DUF4007 family protein [Chloroflexota bacterium]
MTQLKSNSGVANAKLQLSNGYTVDFERLARLLNAVSQEQTGRFSSVELAGAVGVADRHMEGLCSIAQALGLVKKMTYKPTPLGQLVQTHDPFFDDLGTLWFLHYVISSNPGNIIWHRMVTEILPSNRVVSRAQARMVFDDLRESISEASIKKHVLKELNIVLDAYTQQHFARLAYLRDDDSGYAISYRESVPPLILAASIARFRDYYRPGATAITVRDLLEAPHSPGVVFHMGEDRMRPALEELKVQPSFSLESRADLDQVRLADNTLDHEWMRRYYESR